MDVFITAVATTEMKWWLRTALHLFDNSIATSISRPQVTLTFFNIFLNIYTNVSTLHELFSMNLTSQNQLEKVHATVSQAHHKTLWMKLKNFGMLAICLQAKQRGGSWDSMSLKKSLLLPPFRFIFQTHHPTTTERIQPSPS